jgi:hypothetical protein
MGHSIISVKEVGAYFDAEISKVATSKAEMSCSA